MAEPAYLVYVKRGPTGARYAIQQANEINEQMGYTYAEVVYVNHLESIPDWLNGIPTLVEHKEPPPGQLPNMWEGELALQALQNMSGKSIEQIMAAESSGGRVGGGRQRPPPSQRQQPPPLPGPVRPVEEPEPSAADPGIAGRPVPLGSGKRVGGAMRHKGDPFSKRIGSMPTFKPSKGV